MPRNTYPTGSATDGVPHVSCQVQRGGFLWRSAEANGTSGTTPPPFHSTQQPPQEAPAVRSSVPAAPLRSSSGAPRSTGGCATSGLPPRPGLHHWWLPDRPKGYAAVCCGRTPPPRVHIGVRSPEQRTVVSLAHPAGLCPSRGCASCSADGTGEGWWVGMRARVCP